MPRKNEEPAEQAEQLAPPHKVDQKTGGELRARLRILDAATGETIVGVISADAEAGTVKRFDVDEDGSLVREDLPDGAGSRFVKIEEARVIRIEWLPAEDAAS